MNILESISDFIKYLITVSGSLGIIFNCLLITIESMVPILPLAVFITINFINFGSLLGFIISWVFTVIGCSLSFFIFRKGLNTKFKKFIKDKKKLENMMVTVTHISFGQLVILIAIPFTPAFLVNIACGLSDMPYKKFLSAILIGKISLVYFWGYIGTSLMESIKNPIILLKIVIIVFVMWGISKLLNLKLKL